MVVLQVIETISIVILAMPVYICSGILFGKAVGIAICYTTNLILNILIFLAARKMKYVKSKVLNLSKQKTVRKLLDSAKHVDRVVIVMCFLPIVPNGMIPYLSAQTDSKCRDFTRALAIGSAPAIAFYVCCGDILISESYKLHSLLYYCHRNSCFYRISFSKKANRILRIENQKIFRKLIKYMKKTELKKSVPFLM